MRSLSCARALLLAAALVAALLLFAASASVERGRADNRPDCQYGLSSIGPVHFRDGKIVDGDVTPHTESCLP
jgi:hypothetical protein